MHETIELGGLTNAEFFATHAAPGRVGLVGGTALIDRAICRAQRHVTDGAWSWFSHAFFIQGARADGHHWVIESDLDIHRRHVRLGVQENRVSKYHDEELYSTVAILDFGLTPEQTAAIVTEGLNLVADRTRYSLRELLGVMVAIRSETLRGKTNLLSREKSMFCSALVRHLFRAAGVDLAPDLDVKHTAPEDLARSLVPHTTYLLKREIATSKLKAIKRKLNRGFML
ncbi:hypothetical protein KBB96_16695 [Luteolibacter ambystomatis]|uniref:Uncharacterized protein n=1 Tax=Luteolibacter ambystomatis TaxID=2824561 RepID=A0A975IYT9_9BACT|nr:hypothetical protein [Luteolibacter ambystomatis]QUE50489.1 hypothetical protein KBB96_16695 [Luteolibacter ambystomatis]